MLDPSYAAHYVLDTSYAAHYMYVLNLSHYVLDSSYAAHYVPDKSYAAYYVLLVVRNHMSKAPAKPHGTKGNYYGWIHLGKGGIYHAVTALATHCLTLFIVLCACVCFLQEAFGQINSHELKEGGIDLPVTDDNKHEYIDLMLHWRLDRGVAKQMESFKKGFSEVMPVNLLYNFDIQELEFLTAGTLEIDVDDWRAHTEYRNGN